MPKYIIIREHARRGGLPIDRVLEVARLPIDRVLEVATVIDPTTAETLVGSR